MQKSSACRNRHHNKCKGDGCECLCHGQGNKAKEESGDDAGGAGTDSEDETMPQSVARPKTKGNGRGQSIKPCPKNGPEVTLRMRSQAQINRVKRAASKSQLSMNTWAVEVLDRAATASGQ